MSPWRTAAKGCCRAGAAAVAAGQAVIEVDPVVADRELAQGVALSGEVRLVVVQAVCI